MQNDSIDNLRLDLDKSSIRKAIYVRVGDTRARTVHITLVSNGKVVDLTNAVICEVLINKPDGSMNDQAMVQYGNELQYTFRTMDINVPGECTCQVMVTFDDGAVVTSPDFSVMVYEKDVDQQYETSLNEYTAITQQLVDVTQLANQAATDAERAETARENIEDVEARVIVYEGNVEAFTDRAEAAAIAAEASNQSAGDSAEAASEYCATTMGYRDEVANDKQEVDDKANEILGYDYQAIGAATDARAAQLAAETAQSAAEGSATAASNDATLSRSYARGDTSTRTGEATDNAKYYYEQARDIADHIQGALLLQGTITFADLDNVDVVLGYEWNISDDFVSDSRFNDGGGVQYAAGTDVYVAGNLKFDCMTGSAVTGVKGSNESTYRKGYVEITKGNMGLGDVDNTSDLNKPVSTATQTALNGKVDKAGDTMSGNLTIDRQSSGDSFLTVGNNLTSGAVNKSEGMIDIYSSNQYRARISTYGQNYSGDRLFVLPNKNGTFAMTSDLGDLASIDIDDPSSTKYLRGDGTWQNVGSSGHTIVDSSGSPMATRDNMQFVDAHLADDSVNDKTEVEVIKSVASADYSSETEDGLYLIPDGEGSVIEPASEDKKTVSASNDTWNTVLMKLYALIDFDKIKEVSIFSIKSGTSEKFFNISSYDDTNEWLEFTYTSEYTSTTSETVYLRPSNACYYFYNGTNISNDPVANGTLITLYYGNKKAVVDLQTTANRCLYDSNTTVKDRFKWKQLLSTALTTTASNYTLSDSVANYNEIMLSGCWMDGANTVWTIVPVINGSVSLEHTTLHLNNDSSGTAYDIIESLSGSTVNAYGANTNCWLRVYAR